MKRVAERGKMRAVGSRRKMRNVKIVGKWKRERGRKKMVAARKGKEEEKGREEEEENKKRSEG